MGVDIFTIRVEFSQACHDLCKLKIGLLGSS